MWLRWIRLEGFGSNFEELEEIGRAAGRIRVGIANSEGMAADSCSSEQEQDEPDGKFVEVDPTGRYGRVSLIQS